MLTMTDREVLRDMIEIMAAIDGKHVEEKEKTITVLPGGPKYIFTTAGEIKSIIRNGKAFGPESERRYVSPEEMKAAKKGKSND